jgi:exonuclease V gamma subunit
MRTRLENAHCLETINNMWLEKVSARGKKRTLTDSERKRNRSAVSSKWKQYRIYVGDQLDRWNEQKEVLRVQTHAEVAKILLDR